MCVTDTAAPQWVIWNGSAGLLAMADTGRIDARPDGRTAWLARPFDMVGPFNLDELEAEGRIAFAACIVMSRQRWQLDQAELRMAAFAQRQAAQARMHAEHARFEQGTRRRRARHLSIDDEQQHRQALGLPADAPLTPRQIKAAFRRLAQKAHPDQGGDHAAFVRLNAARRALMDRFG